MYSVPFEPAFRKNPFAPVSRIAAFFIAIGRKPPSSNTGDYCNARAELSLKALEDLAVLVSKNTETIVKSDWLWGCKSKKGKHHAKLVDGFTATLSFTRTCAFLLETGTLWALSGIRPGMTAVLLEHLGGMLVEERPERFEPRVIKRRLYKYPLMKKPRHVLKNRRIQKSL